MIEKCEDILECENKLSLITQKVKLLEEFPLSIEEVDKLGIFIKEQISENIQKGTEFLKTKTPTCLACFLVWKGILDYRDGDYWSAIKDSTGLSDPNWQVKWGEIFVDFLETNGLPSFDIKDAHRYVTPILLHGMIPNSCLNEYFEKILIPFKHELADSANRKEISFLLQNRREDNKERRGIEEEVSKLRSKKSQISRELTRYNSLINIWDDLEKLKALEAEAGDPNELVSLPESPSEYRSKKKFAIQNLQKEIEDFKKKEGQYERKIEDYSEQDRQVLIHSDSIVQCVNILQELEQEIRRATNLKTQETLLKEELEKYAESLFSERWDERYGEIIRNLPFDELKGKIEELCSRKANESSAVEQRYLGNILKIIKGWATYILSLFKKRDDKTGQGLYGEIREMLRELPIDRVKIEQPKTELVQSLRLLKDTYENLFQLSESRECLEEENRERINKIKNVAEAVGVDITDNIGYAVTVMQDKLTYAQMHKESVNHAEQEIERIEIRLKELAVKEQSLAEELQEVDKSLAKLGEGDIQLGVERLRQRHDAQNKVKSLRDSLAQTYPSLNTIERERNKAQQDGKDKNYYISEINRLNEGVRQIKEEMNELDQGLEQIPEPFPYVDEPIRRFLLYAGKSAKDFLVQSVQMVNQTIEEQRVPSVDEIGLPERVVAKFGEWLREQEIDDEIVQKSRERFRGPVISLDTAIGSINIHFPPQRFSIPDNIAKVCLIVNEVKPSSHKEQLRVYKYKTFFETEEINFSLPFPSEYYAFNFKNGSDIIKSWDPITGISYERPFMAFDYDSKKLIQGTELPKEMVWIVLHNRFNFELTQVVIEEASLYGKWREYKYLALDLGDIGQLNLLDKRDRKHPISISQKKVFEPALCGGQVLRGCHSEEEDIYIGEPPSISMPIQSVDEIKRWLLSILPIDNSTLTESIHYRLNDLEEILNIDVNEGICKIPLYSENYIGKSPVGKFTVRLKNDIKNIDKRFCFCVVPHLKVEFDKDIYSPSEEDTSQVYLTLDGVEKMKFEPRSPAKVIDYKDHSWKIETNTSEHSIYGTLQYPHSKGDSIHIPITIRIPRLTWRLESLINDNFSSESNRIEEIWFGDWENAEDSLSLIVSMPSSIHGQGQLSLRNSEQMSEAKIMEGKARFDLLGFSDTLRAGVEPLQTFELTVSQSELSIDSVPIFKVRTRWEVEDIECIQSSSEGKIILEISWKKEHGKAEGQRVVKLWRIWEPDSDTITRQVPEGSYSTKIIEEQDKLPPRSYRIQIVVEDPWSATTPSIPSRNSLNTTDIQIQEEILQGQINITSVIDEDDRTHRLNYKYSIHIDGKIINRKLPAEIDSKDILVKEINEGWYVGNVSVITKSGVNPFEKINPLKLEIVSNHVIKAAEDRDGDGAFFCALCKIFFWSEKTLEREKQKGHDNKKYMLAGNFRLKFSFEKEGD